VLVFVPLALNVLAAMAVRGASGTASAARHASFMARAQALRNRKPRQETEVHRQSLPKVTQSLDSL